MYESYSMITNRFLNFGLRGVGRGIPTSFLLLSGEESLVVVHSPIVDGGFEPGFLGDVKKHFKSQSKTYFFNLVVLTAR